MAPVFDGLILGSRLFALHDIRWHLGLAKSPWGGELQKVDILALPPDPRGQKSPGLLGGVSLSFSFLA